MRTDVHPSCNGMSTSLDLQLSAKFFQKSVQNLKKPKTARSLVGARRRLSAACCVRFGANGVSSGRSNLEPVVDAARGGRLCKPVAPSHELCVSRAIEAIASSRGGFSFFSSCLFIFSFFSCLFFLLCVSHASLPAARHLAVASAGPQRPTAPCFRIRCHSLGQAEKSLASISVSGE